jgi:transposase
VALENQIRALAIVFGVRLPRALTAALIDQALKASEGVAGLSAAAGTDCGAHRGLRGPACEDPAVRGRQRRADPLQGPAQAQGTGPSRSPDEHHAQGAPRGTPFSSTASHA